jgi:hypothetical protein
MRVCWKKEHDTMKQMMVMLLVLLVAGCSSSGAPEYVPVGTPKQPSAAGVGDGDTLTDQEKRFFIARHAIERGTPKRWAGFRMVMDLAVKGFAPAKEYYLSIRDVKPVLPGESEASFGLYADALKVILPEAARKIKDEEGRDCGDAPGFAIRTTTRTGNDGSERWEFDYCEEVLRVDLRLSFNPQTGNIEFAIPANGITLQ